MAWSARSLRFLLLLVVACNCVYIPEPKLCKNNRKSQINLRKRYPHHPLLRYFSAVYVYATLYETLAVATLALQGVCMHLQHAHYKVKLRNSAPLIFFKQKTHKSQTRLRRPPHERKNTTGWKQYSALQRVSQHALDACIIHSWPRFAWLQRGIYGDVTRTVNLSSSAAASTHESAQY